MIENSSPAGSILGAAVIAFGLALAPAQAADPIKIGHVAALSGGSAQSGEAITRGLTVAIDEINAKGGLLGGRKLELVQRDDESTPPKGLTAARELMFKEKVAIIFGGIDSPVGMAMAPILNKEKVPHMAVWAAGTGITRNGANPNYIFRVSAVDVLVDVKLLDYAKTKYGAKKAGLMLVNNPWGESNEKGLIEAVKGAGGMEIVGAE
jgi:branched-chain amino acid transport system substrate-binding protein